MKQRIIEELKKLEQEYGMKILFAVESGSRAWKIESKDSDYDVRFVFYYPFKSYLSLSEPAGVINRTTTDHLIDMSGHDIYKFAGLVLKSNPSAIEWLNSDILYIDSDSRKVFRDFINEKFNPIALYEHYKSMMKENFLKYLKTRENITYKKYLYAMRGYVSAKYVANFGEVPPIDFNETMTKAALVNLLDNNIYMKLVQIIADKKKGFEHDNKDSIGIFDRAIETFIKDETQIESKKIKDWSVLQEEIYKILGV